MAKFLGVVLVLLLAAAAAFYFLVHEPLQQRLVAAEERIDAAQREANSLRTRIADLEAIRGELERTSEDLKEAVEAKEKELLALRSTQDELVEGLQKEIADRTVEIERFRDQIRVQMVDEILFDSGEAELKPAGLEVLKRVAAILKKTENRRIEVQGHTDNVPIVGALARRFPTNWELSAARATNVARFLQDKGGLDPALLTAAAYAEFQPRDTNDTEQGRRRNRRIEILLGPVLSQDDGDTAADPSAPPTAEKADAQGGAAS